MANRRSFLQSALGITAGLFASEKPVAEGPAGQAERLKKLTSRNSKASFNVPAITPDIEDLPFTMDGKVKVFHLIAQVISQQINPDKKIAVWGFNGNLSGGLDAPSSTGSSSTSIHLPASGATLE